MRHKKLHTAHSWLVGRDMCCIYGNKGKMGVGCMFVAQADQNVIKRFFISQRVTSNLREQQKSLREAVKGGKEKK